MVVLQSSKLMVRVRFPSSALGLAFKICYDEDDVCVIRPCSSKEEHRPVEAKAGVSGSLKVADKKRRVKHGGKETG